MRMNEENYIAQLRLHNEDALDFVCTRYGGMIKAIVAKRLFYLKDLEEDCVNDILFAVWENIDSYDEEKNTFANWLAAISRYKCIDYLRRHSKRQTHLPIEAAEGMEESAPLDRMMQQELSEQIESMLSCLKEADRELFMRLYVEEQELDQVSRDLGMEKPVIYNRVSRARKKLRRLFPERRKGDRHE